MFCVRCVVYVADPEIRRYRFGHIDFPDSIPHPYSEDDLIDGLPVIPATLFTSVAGRRLQNYYDELIVAARGKSNVNTISHAARTICDHLLPMATATFQWELPIADTFIRGLGLTRISLQEER